MIQTSSFGKKYTKEFQEKLGFIILEDKEFADQMMEVLDVGFFEYKWLQLFVEEIFNYKKNFHHHPTHETIENIIYSKLSEETSAQQIREYYGRVKTHKNDDNEYYKTEAVDFCRKQKLHAAMLEAAKYLEKGNFDQMRNVIDQAMRLGENWDLGDDYLSSFDKRYEGEERSAVSTGFEDFDRVLKGGLGRGEVGCVIAKTGGGKSLILTKIGSTALSAGQNVVYYTLELTNALVGQRFDACLSGIALDELESKKTDVHEAIKKSCQGKLTIKRYPMKTATIFTIRAHLEKLKRTGFNPDVVILDYADLLKPANQNEAKYEQSAEIFQSFVSLAQEMNFVGWTASQTNRTGLKEEVITMEHIADSYNKCHPCDFIFSCSRTIEQQISNLGKFFIAKNRHGPGNTVWEVFFDASCLNIHILKAWVPDVEKKQLSDFKQGNKKKFVDYK